MGAPDAPGAPWSLTGEAVVTLARPRSGPDLPSVPALPAGVHPAPGPWTLVGARFDSSPVGPYLELTVGGPARSGLHVGLCVTTMVVDSGASRVGGRSNWGFPKELGTLHWTQAAGDGVQSLHWAERDIEVSAEAHGPRFPVAVPMRALQRRGGEVVLVPSRLFGWGRAARVSVTTPPSDPLAALAGDHRGLVVSGLRLVVDRPRRPSGLGATLRARQAAPEAALSWGRPTNSGD
jgi:hypothetical protein